MASDDEPAPPCRPGAVDKWNRDPMDRLYQALRYLRSFPDAAAAQEAAERAMDEYEALRPGQRGG